ncbi:MAG TPA: glycosyltransferase family A protein [Candidatus Binatia bacterium]|nr:glycosyltransferase family A protein [Candidatus Binatia bacterium]
MGGSREASPSISVVMPVHNALPYLDESIGSILGQTFTDFEFVILDDASTDGSNAALRRWARKDARIRLYQGRHKLGLTGSSNFVVRKARAPLIARMDADDVSHRERLRKQWETIERDPDIALVGTLYDGIDARGRRVRPRDRWRLAWRTVFPPFPHGSVLFRRAIFDEVGGYREECAGWEDQDLFLRLKSRGRVVVLTETLYHYRFHVSSVMCGAAAASAARVIGLRHRCLAEFRRGRDYTRLLAEAERNGPPPTAFADALYLRGSMRLWAGHPPAILGLVLRHKSLALGPRALRTLVWATWASVSPTSLRLFLRALIRTRDFLASYSVKDRGIYEWRLG